MKLGSFILWFFPSLPSLWHSLQLILLSLAACKCPNFLLCQLTLSTSKWTFAYTQSFSHASLPRSELLESCIANSVHVQYLKWCKLDLEHNDNAYTYLFFFESAKGIWKITVKLDVVILFSDQLFPHHIMWMGIKYVLQEHQRIHSGHIQQGSGQARVQQRRMVEEGAY